MHAALLLAREGHTIEIFEKEPKPGGMLQYYLPKFRFPRKGIEKKAEQLEELGIKINYNVRIGKDRPLDGIVGEFDAVVLAPGEWNARKLGLKGEELENVSYWIDFLRDYNEDKITSLKEKKVVVVGGGDTAIDCARVAIRLGADTTLAYRKRKEDMPAMEAEIKAAEEDDIEFLFNASPLEILGSEKVEKMVFEETIVKESGMEKTGKNIEVRADLVLIAIGQIPDESILENSPYKNFDELPEKVFLAGDLVNEKKLIVTAIVSATEAVGKIKGLLSQ